MVSTTNNRPAFKRVDPRATAMSALRGPRGRYLADRASQLSGVPRTTMYDWHRNDVLVPDYANASPMAWSYRDLVFLRALAWLRSRPMARPLASECVAELRTRLERGENIKTLRAAPRTFVLDDDEVSNLGLERTLFVNLLGEFNLADVVEEFGRADVWGPDLVIPSNFTYISPWVLGGDPCIASTRIQSSSIYILRTERNLSSEQVCDLYPDLRPEQVDDAFVLERRLRGEVTNV